jgi:hypothetical protein
MVASALETFVEKVRSSWGPLSSRVVAECAQHLRTLLSAPPSQAWLEALHREAPPRRELRRDVEHGFMLLAHTEQAGLYRPPHDHGRAWVIYGVQQGALEIRTYARVQSPDGAVELVQRDAVIVRAGEPRIYLPGDIHDTRCVSETALVFRFTERDLRDEDREGRMSRYDEPNQAWTATKP